MPADIMTSYSSRLVLGTAQLGMPYGLANRTGMPLQQEATNIVQTAWKLGVRLFDTAKSYGKSEDVLGTALLSLAPKATPKIITKLPAALEQDTVSHLSDLITESLARLHVPYLEALMFHREEHLHLLNNTTCEQLEKLSQRLVRAIGISVYSPETAIMALNHPALTVVQIPSSIFDRRFEAGGVFKLAARNKKTLFIRSTLLQGAVCMAPDTLPPFLSALRPAVTSLHAHCAAHGVHPAPTAITWALRRHPEALVLFGAETAEQVSLNLEGIRACAMLPQLFWETLEHIVPPQEATLLNPVYWKQPSTE